MFHDPLNHHGIRRRQRDSTVLNFKTHFNQVDKNHVFYLEYDKLDWDSWMPVDRSSETGDELEEDLNFVQIINSKNQTK